MWVRGLLECVYLSRSVSMGVIQMWLRHGKFLPTYFPGEPNQTWPETRETERHNDCLVKRLTAPQADLVMQFSVSGPTRYLPGQVVNSLAFLTNQIQTRSQTRFCAMLFVWSWGGNLCIIWLWFISVENWKWGEGVFRSLTLGPSALPDWPYNITHSITHCRKYC